MCCKVLASQVDMGVKERVIFRRRQWRKKVSVEGVCSPNADPNDPNVKRPILH